MVGRLILAAALVVYGAAALTSGLDRVSANSLAVERVVPRPVRAQADRSAAIAAIARKDAAAAVSHAAAAVSHDPVDRDSTALLGAARLLAGKTDGAAEAFRVAARFGWRNTAAQLYWYQASLQAGQFDLAADRADAILRVHPAFSEREALLQPLESIPAARPFLVQHLAAKPVWLRPYVTVSDTDDEAMVDRRVGVLSQFGAVGSPLGCAEVAQFTRALMDRFRRSDAERVWDANCPESKISGLLGDPDFRLIDAEPPFPFGWRAIRSGDVEVRHANGDGGGVEVKNSAPSTRMVLAQAVSLPPGSYRLKLHVGDAASARAVQPRFSFGCRMAPPFPADTNGDPLAEGQVITVGPCDRQQLGVWVKPGPAAVELTSVAIEKIG